MYIAKVTATVNSIASPALVYNLVKGEAVEADNETILELLKLNMVQKVGEFKPVTELKNNG